MKVIGARPLRVLIGCLVLLSCASQERLVPRSPPTFGGLVTYEDGVPAGGALIGITDLDTGMQVGVLAADADGSFRHSMPGGSYALAVTGEHGYAWIEKQAIPSVDTMIKLSRACRVVTGQADGVTGSTRASLLRRSNFTGDTFLGSVHRNGSFRACLPEGRYDVSLVGDSVSPPVSMALSQPAHVRLRAVPHERIRQGLVAAEPAPGDLTHLMADIARQRLEIVGLGEATHGTAEFVTARATLTLELVRSLGTRLVLIEADAIAGVALDDYINGADLDIAKAVADLGFWVTDTHEFLHFLSTLRQHNQSAAHKVRLWGIDLQNTTRPAEVLLARATELSISDELQALLKQAAGKRGRAIKELGDVQRSSVDALLARLRTPRSSRRDDVLVALAARSLATQFGYWEGDAIGEYSVRRDSGMAELARFLVRQQQDSAPAALWAHDGHVTRESGHLRLGYHLTSTSSEPIRYYAIGFYLHHGATRAWDAAGKIGVISHAVPVAPEYTLEGAIMKSTGSPEIAWVPLRGVPASLRRWLEVPRFVREIGAVYSGERDTLVLRRVLEAFDAVVVLRAGRDSSPTPTGVRTVTK